MAMKGHRVTAPLILRVGTAARGRRISRPENKFQKPDVTPFSEICIAQSCNIPAYSHMPATKIGATNGIILRRPTT